MTSKWQQASIKWFLDALIMQLFLTSFSLPILAAWGMSISWMSLAGNMLFTPFLFAALLVSSLMFFALLLQLPLGSLGWIAHQCCSWWLWCMSWSDPSWQLPLSAPTSCGLLCIIPPLTLLFLTHYKRFNRWHHLGFAASNLLIVSLGILLSTKL